VLVALNLVTVQQLRADRWQAKEQQLKLVNVAVVEVTVRPLCGLRAGRWQNVKLRVGTSTSTHSLSRNMLHRVLLGILL